MKDATGKELHDGQMVVTNVEGYTCGLDKCEIIGFTAKKVRLFYKTKNEAITFLKFPEQVSVVEDNKFEAEVTAWRTRFPEYEYRPQDGCVALKTQYQFQD